MGTQMDSAALRLNIMKSGSEESENEETSTKPEQYPAIELNLCQSRPLVWRTAELKAARELGIVGTLVGSLARQPRQNSRLGRPLELMREEGRMLQEMGKATLIPPRDSLLAVSDVSSERVDQYQTQQEESFVEQNAMALEDRKTVMLRVMTEKHKEGPGSQDMMRERLDALEQGFSFPRSAMAVQICTARAGLGLCPEERSYLAASWPLPRDERSEARFRVFRGLRRKGFYLTSAGKFGGDYLVYPGDPLRFHAHFIAVCLSMDESISLCDILTIARLGSNVKKTVLLCSPCGSDEHDDEEVVYTSLQWSGMT